MKSLCLIHKSISKERKFTEHDYHAHRPRKVLFSEHMYFVQICPVITGPVTFIIHANLFINSIIDSKQFLVPVCVALQYTIKIIILVQTDYIADTVF